MAGHRALAGLSVTPDLVLLDGNHDYLSPPEELPIFAPPASLVEEVPPVVTAIKADMRCAGVASASILAKTARDAIMVDDFESWELRSAGYREDAPAAGGTRLAAA